MTRQADRLVVSDHRLGLAHIQNVERCVVIRLQIYEMKRREEYFQLLQSLIISYDSYEWSDTSKVVFMQIRQKQWQASHQNISLLHLKHHKCRRQEKTDDIISILCQKNHQLYTVQFASIKTATNLPAVMVLQFSTPDSE